MKRTTTAIIALVGILLAGSHHVRASQQEPSENTIVPGVRVGNYTFDMSKDEVLKKLGEPEAISGGYTLNNLPRRYIMFFGDISFGIVDDSVKEITVLGPSYQFTNGLGVGDSEEKIKQAFGNDFQLKEYEWKDLLNYEDKGIRFEIHKKKRTVLEIGINQPKRNQNDGTKALTPSRLEPFDNVGGKDLRTHDLRNAGRILDTLEFNQDTLWPKPDRLPEGFDPKALLQEGMNPGLGVRALHAEGITGAGIHVGLIDQPLLMDHPEYAGKIVSYHDIGCGSSKSSMHGPGMASQLVGSRCGTAPGASLHVVAVPSWQGDAGYYARALDRLVTRNERVREDQKIRLVSVSAQPSGQGSEYVNQSLWDRAVQRAEANGVLVLDCTWHHGFVSLCWLDPKNRERVESCTPGFRKGIVEVDEGHIHVPSAPRTTAEAYADKPFGYAYDGGGRRSSRPMSKSGYSDTIPYTAGILALGWQIRPELTPAQMKEMLFASAYVHKSGARIINPTAFIDLIRNQSDNQHIQTHPQTHSETQTIVPGVRVGAFTFGMSKDEVLRRLGEPKVIFYRGERYTPNNLPMIYFMVFDDVSFRIADDSVKGITVLSPFYKFTNGLGVGDSEQKIKQAFGDDFHFKGADFLAYEDEGLTFEIHKKNRTVMEINVSQITGDHADSDAPNSGKSIMLSEQSPGPITFPKIDRRPKPEMDEPREMNTLPKYDPDSTNPFQMDLRCRDLSKLDQTNSIDDLLYATFDDRTVWPASDKMPHDFTWQKIMELGKNPGLGVRSLHKKGITGRGVRVAIIDQPLLVDHQEYVERVRLYEEIDLQGETDPSMHGAAVASIAVGKTVGVAPEAELYYIAQYNFDRDKGTPTLRSLAKGIHRMLEINEQLPKDKKIRVISISKGWMRSHKDYKVITEAVQKARAAGMLVVCSCVELIHDGCGFGALGRSPLADPEVFESYEPGLFLAKAFRARRIFLPECHFWAPMDSRTTASPTGSDEYVFYRINGVSWTIPYIAGVYALAVQVDPAITPESFWALAVQTGRTIELNYNGKTMPLGPIIDPVRLIRSIKAGELSNKEIFD